MRSDPPFSSIPKSDEKEKAHPGYDPYHDGMLGNGGYNRAVPEHFSNPERGDDTFMNSMMKNYANEEATKDGTPTGKFVFKK